MFDLPELPATLPVKWQKRECDVVRLEVDLLEVTDLFMRVRGSGTRTSLHMTESAGRINVTAESEAAELSVAADFVSLQRISAYRSEAKRRQ